YLGTVRFGVITNKHLAKLVSLVHSGSVYLHRHFNTSLSSNVTCFSPLADEMDFEVLVKSQEVINYTAENIYKWALENRETLLRWLRPHGGKSLLLNNELKKGPALFVFIPFNPLAESHPLIDEDPLIGQNQFQTASESLARRPGCCVSRALHAPLENVYGALCQGATVEKDGEGGALVSWSRRPVWPNFGQAMEEACLVEKRVVIVESGHPHTSHELRPVFQITEVALEYNNCHGDQVVERLLQHLRRWHSISRTHNVCELCVNQTAGGLRPRSVSMPQCSFFEMAAALDSFYLKERTFYHVASDSIECRNFLSFYSPFSYYTACCRTINRGVTGFIDSEQDVFETPTIAFSSLEKKCEVDTPSSVPHIEENSAARVKGFAAIVDVKEESHYVLDPKQALMKFTLESFIQNFSVLYSPLKRHLIGSDSAQFPSQRLITEVTTDTFWEVVLQKQDVLLLYYAQWCGFCPALNHVFIQLARLLPTDTFTVARIDVSQNDLPWEFMVDRLPTVLFFPCNRKDLSVKYPEDLPITLPNLLRFILHHSDPASAPQNLVNPPTKECLQREAVLQQGHISHLEREIQKLRAEISALQQAQGQVEARLSSTRRDEQQLRRQQHTLERQHSLLQRHSEQLQALHEQKSRQLEEVARQLQELADASENLLTENTWLKILVATMEQKLEGRDGAEGRAPPEEARSDYRKPSGAPRLPASTPPPSNVSSTLASERSTENRTD
ncbi:hypothetical protein E2I00_007494, partial [Balaenoptera physalus]